MSATGRNNQASTLGTNVTLLVETYRQQYNYPSWFENTLGYAESGQINALALQQAAGNLLDQGHMTRKPQFNQGLSPTDRKRETETVIEDYFGDDITRLTEGHTMQEARLTTGMEERASIQNKIQTNTDSIQDIWNSIGQKADMSHTHEGMGGVKECAWYDIGCKMNEGFAGLGKLALIGGAGNYRNFSIKNEVRKMSFILAGIPNTVIALVGIGH